MANPVPTARMKITAFAFKNNISSKVLQKLTVTEKKYLNSNKQQIAKTVDEIIENKPEFILGLGMYSGRDRDKLRIETHYSKDKNKFPINYFLIPGENTKLANGIGNSYCNFVSQKIMEMINKNKLKTKYTFVHIPINFNVKLATEEIENKLKNIIMKL